MIFAHFLKTPSLFYAFLLCQAYWIVFAMLAFLSALTDTFHPWVFGVYLVCGFILLLQHYTHVMHHVFLRTRWFLLAIGLIILTWSFYTTPTIFTGRDQGSIATAAIFLADHGTRAIHTPISDAFFSVYGQGKALHFPGFFYTADGALTSQFPLPYIAWNAAFYGLFGITGFIIGNAVLAFLFFSTLLLLIAQLLRASHDHIPFAWRTRLLWIGVALIAGIFPIGWFFRYTLTENMAQWLLWLLATLLVFLVDPSAISRRTDRIAVLALAYFTGTLLLVTRIEGIAFFAIGWLIVLLAPHTADLLRVRPIRMVILPLITSAMLLGITVHQSRDFYKSIAKALIGDGDGASSTQTFSWITSLLERHASYAAYGITPLLLIAFGALWYLWRHYRSQWYLFIPFFLTCPTLLYLAVPHISGDTPWMLRRLSFAIVPCGILYTLYAYVLLITHTTRRKRALLITGISVWLVVWITPASYDALRAREYTTLLPATASFATQWFPQDAILIDRGVSGDPFSMIAGPLLARFHVNAAYFFNPEDFARVPFGTFRRIFLVVPMDRVAAYQEALPSTVTLTPITTWSVSLTRFAAPSDNTTGWQRATPYTTQTTNKIFAVTFQ